MNLFIYFKYSKEKYLDKKEQKRIKIKKLMHTTIDKIEEAINNILKMNKIEEEDEGI